MTYIVLLNEREQAFLLGSLLALHDDLLEDHDCVWLLSLAVARGWVGLVLHFKLRRIIGCSLFNKYINKNATSKTHSHWQTPNTDREASVSLR